MPYRSNIKKESKRSYAVLENVQFTPDINYFNSFCGIDKMMPNKLMESDESDSEGNILDVATSAMLVGTNSPDGTARGPYIKITEQPVDTFRYRYESEKGSHGGIKGENFSRSNKSYPEVKLENAPLNQRIKIKVSLYTNDKDPKPHVYELTGKNCQKGQCLVDLNEDFIASFPSLAIQTRKREEVIQILLKRKISDYGSKRITQEIKTSLEKKAQEEVKKINLDSARLCFEAFLKDDLSHPICNQVFSNPINNQKSAASGDLKIDRLSRITGKCTGGDEIFLFCEKVKKEDIKVRFCEKDDAGTILWQEFGNFSPADVHHQVAIAFRTPAYKPVNAEKVVNIELFRPSDEKCSESLAFTYVPDDEVYEKSRKRKRVDSLYASISQSEFVCTNCSHNLADEILNTGIFGNDFIANEDENAVYNYEDELLKAFLSEDLGEIYPTMEMSECIPDSVSDVLDKMTLLSLDEERKNKLEHSCSSKPEKIRHKLKDYADGINKILKNRENSTYLFYGPRLFLIQDENGNSMLHLAILEQSDNINLIQMMLNMISEEMINKTNKFKETPLHLAVKGNHLKIVLLLLIKGGDPNISDLDGNNCLHLTAQKNNTQCMKILLTANENLRKYKMTQIDILNHDGMSPLHIAIVNNSEDCVNYLLDVKADVNLCEIKCGQSPLHLAIEHPSLMHKILKQPEINVQVKDFRGYTAFYLACMKYGILFEKDIENDAPKIIKFLENLHVQKKTELKTYESESTDYSDYEDAAEQPEKSFGEHYNTHNLTNTMNYASTSKDSEYINGNESFFMKIEKELCKYLDSDDNWKKLADVFGIDIKSVALFDEKASPGKTVIKVIKKEYHPLDMNKMREILEMVGLEEGIQILQKTCVS